MTALATGPYSLDEYRLAVEAEQAKRSLRVFMKLAWNQVDPDAFVPNWHVDCMADHLEACSRGQILRLAVNVPPGFAKSLTTSVFWPAWEWTWQPKTRWLATSHRGALAIRDSVRCRRLLDSAWYRERWGESFTFSKDQNQKTRYENDRGGHRISFGVGSATGERGDRVLCDDPHEILMAESDIQREAVLEWWDGTIQTRGGDPETFVQVVIQQRVHEKDLTGHLIEVDPDLVVLKLPMRYEGEKIQTGIGWDDPRTVEGELLFPQRFPESVVARLEARLQWRAAGQLQQRPTAREGGMLKPEWFEIVELEDVPAFMIHLRYWDLAATEKITADWTVGARVAYAIETDTLYVMDIDRFQKEPHEVETLVKQRTEFDGYGVLSRMEEEGGSSGKSLISHYERNVLKGYSFKGHAPSGPKEVRALLWVGAAASGRMKLVRGDWNEGFLAEGKTFPRGAHDDQIDAVSGAVTCIQAMLEEMGVQTPLTFGGTSGWGFGRK